MANSRSSGANKEYATVDTLPDAGGYFTNVVDPRELLSKRKIHKIFFSIRETAADLSAAPSDLSTTTVRLQYKCEGDARWTDYVPLDGSSFAIGNRVAISEMGAGVKWRAGVTDVDYVEGDSVTFGFDW